MSQRLKGYFVELLYWLAPLTFLGIFYLYPLGSVLRLSFQRSQEGAFYSFVDALASPLAVRVLGFTFGQAFLSTLLTLLVGLPGAYLLARYDFRGKALFQALMGIPFIMPTLVVAAAFNALLGPRGWINLGLMALFKLGEAPVQFTNTLTAILVAHVFYNTTIVLRMVGDFWSHLDPRLEQAANVLGANRFNTFCRVTVPLLAPAIAAAALLVFIFDFTSFGVVLVLGGPRFSTLEVEIYYQTVSLFNLPLAASLSILQLICTLGMTIVYTWLNRRVSKPITIRPSAFTRQKLHTWRRRLFAGTVMVVLFVWLITPLAALALRSITRLEIGNTQRPSIEGDLTLAYYRELAVNRRQSIFYQPPMVSIAVSLAYAAVTVVLAVGLGLPAAWVVAQRERFASARILDPLLMLPLGTSAVTLGLGFIVALDHPPLDLRTSPLLVPCAHTLVAFPFVVRSLAPALRSIRQRLREAGAILGASPGQVFRYIDLPLIGRALLVAAIFAFTISLGEFGATSLIARPEYPTLPVAIYRYISQPGTLNYGMALALSTILMLVCTAGMLGMERLRTAGGAEF